MTSREKRIARAKLLREQGLTYQEIADILGVSHSTIRDICVRLRIRRGDYRKKKNSKRQKIEAFLEDGVLSQNRIAEQMNVSRQYVSQIKLEIGLDT